MKAVLTTKDLADAIGVSESSMRRWTDSGAIRTTRTVGGHRRIPLAEAIRFIRETRTTIVRPDLLGMPELARATADALGEQPPEEILYTAMREGDEARARGQILSLFLGGMSAAALFDGALRSALHRIGELWQHDAKGILIEHRAIDICLQLLGQLRQMVRPAEGTAKVAIGGAPTGDPYLIPSAMAATALSEAGLRAINFGPDTPLDLLAGAAEEHGAAMVWLSISSWNQKSEMLRGIESLASALDFRRTPLVIGGRRAGDLAVRNLPGVHLAQSMTELAAFARGILASPHPG